MKLEQLIATINSWNKQPSTQEVWKLSENLDKLPNRKGVGEAVLALAERMPHFDGMLHQYLWKMPAFPENVIASVKRVPSTIGLMALFLGVGRDEGTSVAEKKRVLAIFRKVSLRKDIKAIVRGDAREYAELTVSAIARSKPAPKPAPAKPAPSPRPEKPPKLASVKELTQYLVKFRASDDEFKDVEKLDAAVSAWEKLGKPPEVIDAMLRVFERHPESAEFGNPGLLVHAIESIGPAYQEKLLRSVKKAPSMYGLLMVRRILNASKSPQESAPLLKLLQSIAKDKKWSPAICDEAAEILEDLE